MKKEAPQLMLKFQACSYVSHMKAIIPQRSLNSSPLCLIDHYLNEPMFFIRTFDCITTQLIFKGSAEG